MTATPSGANSSRRRIVLLLIGIPIGLALLVPAMVFAFIAPAIGSGPSNLPIAVSGPAPVVEQLTATLDTAQPTRSSSAPSTPPTPFGNPCSTARRSAASASAPTVRSP